MVFQVDKVIGHRGACGYAPENTLISMSKAHELGTKWVEFDVMLAGTGEPIIIHDLTLERTTNGSGEVANTDFKTLATLDCGSWFSQHYAGEKIPALGDILKHVSYFDMGINVEIKPSPGQEILTAVKTIEMLKEKWPKYCKMPLISSFSIPALNTVFNSKLPCKIGYIIDSWEEGWEAIINQFGCFSLHIDHHILTPERVKQIKELGLFVLAYTINDTDRARELFDWGVDSVFSDYPDIILSVVE